MQISDYISITALFISIISLAILWYFSFRDKAQMKTFAKFYPNNPKYDRAHIAIKVVNSGRRPTILTMFGGDLKDGRWIGTYLGKEGKGLRLGEHEKYETSVYFEGISFIVPEGNESEYINFWFENTLGQRYKVKNSEKLIEKFNESTNS